MAGHVLTITDPIECSVPTIILNISNRIKKHHILKTNMLMCCYNADSSWTFLWTNVPSSFGVHFGYHDENDINICMLLKELKGNKGSTCKTVRNITACAFDIADISCLWCIATLKFNQTCNIDAICGIYHHIVEGIYFTRIKVINGSTIYDETIRHNHKSIYMIWWVHFCFTGNIILLFWIFFCMKYMIA